jgi:hypothetical protein
LLGRSAPRRRGRVALLIGTSTVIGICGAQLDGVQSCKTASGCTTRARGTSSRAGPSGLQGVSWRSAQAITPRQARTDGWAPATIRTTRLLDCPNRCGVGDHRARFSRELDLLLGRTDIFTLLGLAAFCLSVRRCTATPLCGVDSRGWESAAAARAPPPLFGGKMIEGRCGQRKYRAVRPMAPLQNFFEPRSDPAVRGLRDGSGAILLERARDPLKRDGAFESAGAGGRCQAKPAHGGD